MVRAAKLAPPLPGPTNRIELWRVFLNLLGSPANPGLINYESSEHDYPTPDSIRDRKDGRTKVWDTLPRGRDQEFDYDQASSLKLTVGCGVSY